MEIIDTLIDYLIENDRVFLIPVALILIIFVVWPIAHYNAQPGTTVRVLWGFFEYTKAENSSQSADISSDVKLSTTPIESKQKDGEGKISDTGVEDANSLALLQPKQASADVVPLITECLSIEEYLCWTPGDIVRQIRISLSNPYESKLAREYFLGKQVRWSGSFQSRSKNLTDPYSIDIMLSYLEDKRGMRVYIHFTTSLDRYPRFRFMEKGCKISITGTITDISESSVYLEPTKIDMEDTD